MRLADLSVEAGHSYKKDLTPGALKEHYSRIALSPWLSRPVVNLGDEPPTRSLAIMLDDYHQRPDKVMRPADVIGMILEAVASVDMPDIDYFAREAACTSLAPAVGRLLSESPCFREDESSQWFVPLPRKAVAQTAMNPAPEAESVTALTVSERIARSVLTSIEFWSAPSFDNGKRPWACPLLASIWQMVRMGGLEALGGAEAMDDPMGFNHPQLVDPGNLPDWQSWDEMPALIQLRPDAAPFAAKQVVSILPADFLGVERCGDIIRDNISVVPNGWIGRDMYTV